MPHLHLRNAEITYPKHVEIATTLPSSIARRSIKAGLIQVIFGAHLALFALHTSLISTRVLPLLQALAKPLGKSPSQPATRQLEIEVISHCLLMGPCLCTEYSKVSQLWLFVPFCLWQVGVGKRSSLNLTTHQPLYSAGVLYNGCGFSSG